MKKITIESVSDLLQNKTIELKSTHPRLSYPIINRIYKKMVIGVKFTNIEVCDGVIINGHHRYLASLLAGIKLDVNPSAMSSAKEINSWKTVILDENDWDNEADIIKFNQEDAEYSNIELNLIESL